MVITDRKITKKAIACLSVAKDIESQEFVYELFECLASCISGLTSGKDPYEMLFQGTVNKYGSDSYDISEKSLAKCCLISCGLFRLLKENFDAHMEAYVYAFFGDLADLEPQEFLEIIHSL